MSTMADSLRLDPNWTPREYLVWTPADLGL